VTRLVAAFKSPDGVKSAGFETRPTVHNILAIKEILDGRAVFQRLKVGVRRSR
jgi:hypothetical protein